MKSIREKMTDYETLTLGEWSTLAAVKLFALSIVFGAIAGIVGLAFKPSFYAIQEGNFFLVLVYILVMVSTLEGALVIAKKVHDKLLTLFEFLFRQAA